MSGPSPRSARVLLVEPAYRSKFPPLGLMRLSTYHYRQGDRVAFVRDQERPGGPVGAKRCRRIEQTGVRGARFF